MHRSPGQGQAASPSPEPRELVPASLGAGVVVTGYSYGGTGDRYGGCWVLVQRSLGMGMEFTGGRSWGLLSSSSCECMASGLTGLILVAEVVFGRQPLLSSGQSPQLDSWGGQGFPTPNSSLVQLLTPCSSCSPLQIPLLHPKEGLLPRGTGPYLGFSRCGGAGCSVPSQ